MEGNLAIHSGRYRTDSRQIRQFPDGCDYRKGVFCRGNGDSGLRRDPATPMRG